MKKVLITGGNKGIGSALVKKYLDNNYEVFTTYCHDKEFIRIPNVTYLEFDLDNKDSIDQVVNDISNIDILINNASICNDNDIHSKSFDDFKKIINVNLIGTLYLTSEITKNKLTKGNIIFISSDNALNENYPESIDYDASKAGLIKVADDFAKYLAPNIRVNVVAPGWVNTAMNKDMDKMYKEEVTNRLLMNRFAKPEEIANVVYFLTSDEASYVNGTTVCVNGGIR